MLLIHEMNTATNSTDHANLSCSQIDKDHLQFPADATSSEVNRFLRARDNDVEAAAAMYEIGRAHV